MDRYEQVSVTTISKLAFLIGTSTCGCARIRPSTGLVLQVVSNGAQAAGSAVATDGRPDVVARVSA